MPRVRRRLESTIPPLLVLRRLHVACLTAYVIFTVVFAVLYPAAPSGVTDWWVVLPLLLVAVAVAWFRAWSLRRTERSPGQTDLTVVTSFRAMYLILAGLSLSAGAWGVVATSSGETWVPCLLGAIVTAGCLTLIAPGRRNVEEFASRLRVSGYGGDLLTALMSNP